MKKIFAFIIITVIIILPLNALAEKNDIFTEGAYYQLGKYNEKPILWRSVSTDDENGILMLSDKILCFKVANAGENMKEDGLHLTDNTLIYGNNFWETSTLRIWLNSSADAGEVEWMEYPPDYEHINTGMFQQYETNYPYSNEKGFLSNDNFSESEKSVLKSVTQWQMLPGNYLNYSCNNYFSPFITKFYTWQGQGANSNIGKIGLFEIATKGAEVCKGAAYRLTDTIFILDELQLKNIYNVLGWDGFSAEAVEKPQNNTGTIKGKTYSYWLRSPYNNISDYNWPNNNIEFNVIALLDIDHSVSGLEHGVRPAFYLNEDTAYIKSGSGTEDDPYILDGTMQDNITVFANGKQLDFAQQPIIENDSTLVGMRTVFETLGADVAWNGENKTVTAVRDDTRIELQIDNNIMQVNDEAVELTAAARLVNDNTMVPLRAVSEALDAKVEWIEDLQRIVIDEQPEWVESDWNPECYQQAMRVCGYIK